MMHSYNRKPRWTAAQNNFLRENWHKMKDEDIAARLGKSLKSVRKKRENWEMIKESGRGVVKKREGDKRPAPARRIDFGDYMSDLRNS